MAGGVGSRFWPMSTPEKPKQFIDVLGIGKSLIQLTVERFETIIPIENVWIVTSEKYKNIVREQLPEIPETQILLEPCMRNTAPCIEYVSRKIYAKYPEANLVFSPADHIVLDVKVGSGAFMKDVESATKLAEAMVQIGKLANRDTVATLTDMSQPLGCAVGNSLEVIEAIETLKGNGPKDFTELCIELTAEILLIAKVAKDLDEARTLVLKAINERTGLEKLRQMVKWQGGNPDVIDDYSLFGEASEVVELVYEAEQVAYVESIDALCIGNAAMILGAGRLTKEDLIDHQVGIVLNKKVGDMLKQNDLIATIYSNGKNTNECMQRVLDAYLLTNKKIKKEPIVIKTIRG